MYKQSKTLKYKSDVSFKNNILLNINIINISRNFI